MWLHEYRDLIWNLTVTDLKVKYQSSFLGFLWSLLNPLLMMIVLYFVFVNVFRFEIENFALYLLVGIITWRFFANGTTYAMASITGKSSLVTKIFIPRQILVMSSTISSFISSLLEFFVLIPLLAILGIVPTPYILLFPLVHALYFVFVYGISLALSSLYVYYRDLNQIWDVIIQLGFFVAPIVYPLSIIPEQYLDYYLLNPLTLLVGVYRDILLYGTMPLPDVMLYLIVTGAGVLICGSFLFNRLERRFAEVI